MKSLLSYVMNVLYAADVLLCAVCGGPRFATCSAYAFEVEKRNGRCAARVLIDAFSSRGHCRRAHESWRRRVPLPKGNTDGSDHL